MENGWTADQGALFLIIIYLNFDILLQLKDGEWTNSSSPRCFDLNHNIPEFSYPVAIFPLIQQIFNLFPQLKDGEWLICCPGCFVYYHNLPDFWYPFCSIFPQFYCFFVLSVERMLKRSANSACWLFKQFCWRLTSDKGWRMVEQLPKVLCFLS